MLQLSWPAVSAILALIPICAALFGRELALRFRAELAEFRNSLLEDLANKYMLREDAERRLDALERELRETRHGMRNDLQKLMSQLQQWEWERGQSHK